MKRVPTALLTLSLLSACGGGGRADSGSGGASGLMGGAGTSGGQASGGVAGNGGSASGSSGSGGTLDAGAPVGGGVSSGGVPGNGGSSSGSSGEGGNLAGGGGDSADGGVPSGGGTATGGGNNGGHTATGDCTFSVTRNEVSPQMATVGIVEWTVDGVPTNATIVYELDGGSSAVLNRGGEAPVDLERDSYRTLLLGLKQESNYRFYIEATVGGEACTSPSYSLPPTGTLDLAPTFSVDVVVPEAREPGFIVTATGYTTITGDDSTAFIIDADGDIVWAAPAPSDTTRAKMDYEGENMWMLALNFIGGVGEMRYLSMDGLTGQNDVEGLDRAHHDFTVMPGGKVATVAWTAFVTDSESDLVIRSPDGTVEIPFRIGENIYASNDGRYHTNALHYIEEDESFTISERYPGRIVKVGVNGELHWQLGATCTGAPAGPDKCSAQTWTMNHGHHLLSDGSLLLFSNDTRGGDYSYVVELDITETESSMSAALVKDYEGTGSSGVLGDVQRLPGGNTLITYSDDGQIVEVDASWQVVQTFSGSVGYADWRPTLYGPPARL